LVTGVNVQICRGGHSYFNRLNKMKKWKYIGILVVVLIIGLIFILSQKGDKKKENIKATKVQLAYPQQDTLIEYVNAPGEVQPVKRVDISAKISARIEALPFLEGEAVEKDKSLLVKLDASDLYARVLSSKARLASEKAQLEVAKVDLQSQEAGLVGLNIQIKEALLKLNRQKHLLATKDVSQGDVDVLQSKYDQLIANLDKSTKNLSARTLGLKVREHNLEAAGAEVQRTVEALTYTDIYSPINGVVTRVNAQEGELVMTGTMNNRGTVIIQVADLSSMLLVTEVSEMDVMRISVGQPANIFIQAIGDEIFNGHVESVALTHDIGSGGSKYYKTKVLIDNVEGRILSGLTAQVDIEVNRHDELWVVPSQAILACKVDELPVDIRKGEFVNHDKAMAPIVYRFIDGKAVITPVRLGASSQSHTVIEGGVTGAEQIVVGPYKVLEKIKHNQHLKNEVKEKDQDEKVDDDIKSAGEASKKE